MRLQHPPHPIERLLQRGGFRPSLRHGVGPELELCVHIAQGIGHQGDAAHRYAAHQYHIECPAGRTPEVGIECPRRQPDGTLGRGIINMTHRHQ